MISLIARALGDGVQGNHDRCEMSVVCKSWNRVLAEPFCWEPGREAAIQAFILLSRLELGNRFEAMHRVFRFTVAEVDRMGILRHILSSKDAIKHIKRARVLWPQLDLTWLLDEISWSLVENPMQKLQVLRDMGLDLRSLRNFVLAKLVNHVVGQSGIEGLAFLRDWGMTIEDVRRCKVGNLFLVFMDAEILMELASWGLVKEDLIYRNHHFGYWAAIQRRIDVLRVLVRKYGLTRDDLLGLNMSFYGMPADVYSDDLRMFLEEFFMFASD